MKKVIIFGIIVFAMIGFFAFSDSINAVNVKSEVATIRKLEKDGKKAEAEERMKELMAEVDRLFKEGKKEESHKLYNDIWIELHEQSRNDK